MIAVDAFKTLDPEAWTKVGVVERLALIETIQDNMLTFAEELGDADAAMKNDLAGNGAVSQAEGIATTLNAMGNTMMGIRHMYESLVHGEMPQANGSREIGEGLYEVDVYPIHRKDKLLAGKGRGFLHVEGAPKQVNPLDKPAGVIAVSGAGNYSSSIEMAMALFLENKAVIHKPHALNQASDDVWAKVFAPLVDMKALAFIDGDQGREMAALAGLDAIYFTGSTGVAHAIQDAASAPLVSECGGNNPCLIVPGEWTDKEMEHWAIQIASAGKLNGGAVCGRPQTIITSKNWPQREQFIAALRKAIAEDTFGTATYYPGVDKTKERFLKNQPTAEILQPEGGAHPASDFVLIPGIKEDDFAVTNEAFCQIFSELPLDTENTAEDFLTKATVFCNDKLLGTLGCMLLVDNTTLKANEDRVHQAVNELNYGGIAVNNIPPNIWLNGYLTWGGCGETTENFVSGVGNFGNGLNFENIKKSVIIDDFAADTFALTNRKQIDHLLVNASKFSVDQSWGKFAKLAGQMVVDGLRRKDF
ncbi:aldehyde dehydrogenase family protein [Cognatishimia activa]|uniref:Succinylglutamic semialdehyde dehydrogenase n=1 Tax=Cognatishimia activa TaxID=1715691 RepID=A0A0P1IPM2_9RHOB|nr:aldehyde dehydrogenase family protein [Cognatishimia activa]CUI85824.1 succinylglutamic semialdehyde dehydrogenase [Cognatishimia activa]CUK25565.1 succinylglutamic semialdehyde dehydrogenase [Cognatishimia activa]